MRWSHKYKPQISPPSRTLPPWPSYSPCYWTPSPSDQTIYFCTSRFKGLCLARWEFFLCFFASSCWLTRSFFIDFRSIGVFWGLLTLWEQSCFSAVEKSLIFLLASICGSLSWCSISSSGLKLRFGELR